MEFVNYNENEKIPAAVWFRAILPIMREGYQLKICPAGRSMRPFLRGGRDEAVLSVPGSGRQLKKNDIVLYSIETGIYVLHRICRINRDGIYTMGDGNRNIEGPLQREEILAVTEYIIRKGKKISNDDPKYKFLVNLWRILRPFRPAIFRGYSVLKQIRN